MPAKYIYRMDDITPDMDWDKFWKFINLFKEHNIKPLLGIVPDNRDPKLCKGEKREDFWDVMRKLQQEGIVDFAQHGYRHVYVTKKCGLQGAIYGFTPQSEFVGLTYKEQYEKIKAGREILKNQNINTDIWMAPSHSYDRTTLKVLYELGFKAVTDGISLFPYKKEKLLFIPQQCWRPIGYPIGVITICIHSNEARDDLFGDIRNHVKTKAKFVSFTEIPYAQGLVFKKVINKFFQFYFITYRKAYKVKRRIKQIVKGG